MSHKNTLTDFWKLVDKTFICAYCGEPLDGTFAKVGSYYFHNGCKKVVSRVALQKAGRIK